MINRLVKLTQQMGELKNAQGQLQRLEEATQSRLNTVQEGIDQWERKKEEALQEQTPQKEQRTRHQSTFDSQDMSLSEFNFRRGEASRVLINFIFNPGRKPGNSRDKSLSTYWATHSKQEGTSENASEEEKRNAALRLIAAYKEKRSDETLVAERHRPIVNALSMLLSGNGIERIPSQCLLKLDGFKNEYSEDYVEQVATIASSFFGKKKTENRKGALDEAAEAMTKELDEKAVAGASNNNEPSAVQFYHVQEWMVEILVKNYLAKRWVSHEQDGGADQYGLIQITGLSKDKTLKRSSDDCFGFYNAIRSKSRSLARFHHALETIEAIRQATDLTTLETVLEDRSEDNRQGWFSYSLSDHSLHENYGILKKIVSYAQKTTDWGRNSTIDDWQEQCLQAKFDGFCGLFATDAEGLRPTL